MKPHNLIHPPHDVESMGLSPGIVYDRSALQWTGWANQHGDVTGEDVADYYESDYWDAAGAYHGPDQHGIFPTYRLLTPAEKESAHARP